MNQCSIQRAFSDSQSGIREIQQIEFTDRIFVLFNLTLPEKGNVQKIPTGEAI